MKKISFFLTLIILFGLMSQLTAQNPVAGRYKGHMVKMRYVSGNTRDDIEYLEYDGVELTKKISDLNSQIADLNNQIKSLKSQTPKPPKKDSAPKTDTAQERRLWELEGENHRYRSQVDSLEKQVVLLKDSVRFFKESLRKVNHELDSLSRIVSERSGDNVLVDNYSQSGSHIGAYCRLSCPWLINSCFSQTNDLGEQFWNRQVKLSHQIGIYWNSASLLDRVPITLGAGLEYSLMRFSAGIGHLEETIENAIDSDDCRYVASLAYNNVRENASLHYIGIPLSFSIGAPRADRISGYFQISLVPSILLKDSLTVSGNYSCAGRYDSIEGNPVQLYLTNFSPLGFGNFDLGVQQEESAVNTFMLSGRLSGGVFIPLCNTAKGKTSQWVVKLGVNLDFAIRSLAKQAEKDVHFPNAKYRLNQYNLLSGPGCRYVSPSLEMGVLYIFNKNNR